MDTVAAHIQYSGGRLAADAELAHGFPLDVFAVKYVVNAAAQGGVLAPAIPAA